MRGVALMRSRVPDGWTELPADDIDSADEGARQVKERQVVVRLPSLEQVLEDKEAYARASRVLHRKAIRAMRAVWCRSTGTATSG
jgi:hypothetical protein